MMATVKLGSRRYVGVLLAALYLQACGGAAFSKSADVAPSAPMTEAAPQPTGGSAAAPAAGMGGEAMPSGVPMAAAAPEMLAAAPTPTQTTAQAPTQPNTPAPARTPTTTATDNDAAVIAQARKMVDIEARLSVEVADVQKAAESVRKLANKSGAQIINENLNVNAGNATAEIALRVPAEAAGDFLSAIEGVGAIRSRNVTAKDIGKEYYDATIRLANLEVVRKRYEDILQQAKTIDEILRLEGELSRIRQQIEQLKGEIRWMRDRAARATVYISLFTHAEAPPEPILAPEAKLYPGVHASYLRDFRGDAGSQGYLGAGLSLGVTPQANLELQGFREVGSSSAGLDGLFVTINGRFYSEFLGDGEREFLNPYLGLRGGYARFLSNNEILLGGTLGVEIFKGKWFVLEADVRSYALFASDAGGHLGVEPSIGGTIAF